MVGVADERVVHVYNIGIGPDSDVEPRVRQYDRTGHKMVTRE